FLKALQSEADGHMLGRLHQKGCVGLFRGNRGSQACQQLLQVDLGVRVNRAEFFLQQLRLNIGIAAYLSKSREQAYGLDDFFLLQGHDATRPGATTVTAAWRAAPGLDVRNAPDGGASRRSGTLGAFRGR